MLKKETHTDKCINMAMKKHTKKCVSNSDLLNVEAKEKEDIDNIDNSQAKGNIREKKRVQNSFGSYNMRTLSCFHYKTYL